MEASPKTPAEVAKDIAELYEKPFGGKERGRFRVSRRELCAISGRKRLEDAKLHEIIAEAYELGFVIMTLRDEEFAIIEESVVQSYRKLSKKMVASALAHDAS